MHYEEVGDLCIVKQDDGAVSHSSTEVDVFCGAHDGVIIRGKTIGNPVILVDVFCSTLEKGNGTLGNDEIGVGATAEKAEVERPSRTAYWKALRRSITMRQNLRVL